jgi:hypothetical protein
VSQSRTFAGLLAVVVENHHKMISFRFAERRMLREKIDNN